MFGWFKNLFEEDKTAYTDSSGYTYMVGKSYLQLIESADKGNEASQFELATDYYAMGIEYVPEIVFKWTKHLSEKENDFSIMFEMGELYEKGIGTEVDHQEAINWYKKTLELLKTQPDNFHIPASPLELEIQVEEAIKELSEKLLNT